MYSEKVEHQGLTSWGPSLVGSQGEAKATTRSEKVQSAGGECESQVKKVFKEGTMDQLFQKMLVCQVSYFSSVLVSGFHPLPSSHFHSLV